MININGNLNNKMLLDCIHRAAREYSRLIDNEYLFIGKNRDSDYVWFRCYFEKKHFMHLLGIDCKSMEATAFFDKANNFNNGKGTGIQISECNPSRKHNRETINKKSSCCAAMLHLEDAKYLNVGMKELTTQEVDFDYTYGNEATLGFAKKGASSIPITLIPSSIEKYSIQKYRVIFLFRKKRKETVFSDLVVQSRKGLFDELYPELPAALKVMVEEPATKKTP